MPSAAPEVRELLDFHYECLQGMYFSSHEKVNEGDLLFSENITDPYYNFLAPTTSQPIPKAISDEFARRNRQPAIYLTPLAEPRHPEFRDLSAWAQDAWLVATTDTLTPPVEHDPGLTMGIVGPQDRERYIEAFALAYSGDDPQDPYGQLDPAYSSCLRQSFEHHSPEFRKYYVIATQGDVAVGIASMFTNDSLAGVYGVGTIPSQRGRGIGGALMSYLATIAIKDGVSHILLQTEAESPVQRWYEKLGYRHIFTAPYLLLPTDTDE